MSIRLNGVNVPSTLHETSNISHGAYHIANNPDQYEIQRSNNYMFVVPFIEDLLRPGMIGIEDNAYIAADFAQEALRIAVTSAAVPHFTQEAITVRKGNTQVKFAGVPTFGPGNFVFNDYIGADVADILQAWQALSYDIRTEKVGLVGDYKRDCYLVVYTPDFQVVRRYIMHGCWISGLQEGDFNDENNEKRAITATITYDWAEIDRSESL